MRRLLPFVTWMKRITLAAMLLGFSGGCVQDNLWADLWSYSIITGVVEAARNTVLVAANLQTP